MNHSSFKIFKKCKKYIYNLTEINEKNVKHNYEDCFVGINELDLQLTSNSFIYIGNKIKIFNLQIALQLIS